MLIELGQETILDTDEFTLGDDFTERMDQAFRNSDHTVCVITEDYFDSLYTTQEFEDALNSDDGRNRRLIIILAGEATEEDIPPEAQNIIRLDIRHLSDGEAEEKFKFQFDKLIRETIDPYPEFEHEVQVMFARFREDNTNSEFSNPWTSWHDQLKIELENLLTEKDVAFVQISDEIWSEEEAHQLLVSSGAQLIIWGSYGNNYISIYYTFNQEKVIYSGLDRRYLRSSQIIDLDRGWVEPGTLTAYLEERGDVEYHILLLLSILGYQNEQYSEAVELLDECEALFPTETLPQEMSDKYLSGLLAFRGINKNGLENYDSAITDLDRAIELNPILINAINNRGYAKSQLKMYEDAIVDIDQVIGLDPNNAVAYNNRGLSKLQLEKYEDAVLDLDQAIRLGLDNDAVYYNRGSVRIELGMYEDAISDFSHVIELNPNPVVTAIAHSERSYAMIKIGRYEDAVIDLKRSIELNPDDPPKYLALSHLYRFLGDRVRAKNYLSEYKRALKSAD